MKKSLLLIVALSMALLWTGCKNNSDDSSSDSDVVTSTTPGITETPESGKPEGVTENGIRFKGIGKNKITITADKLQEAARAIQASDSLKSILEKDKLLQCLDFEIVYNNRNISYSEYTGYNDESSIEKYSYCNNQSFKCEGPMHKYSDYDFVWVTHPVSKNHNDYDGVAWDENSTVVVIRYGDWKGNDVNIENVVGGMSSIRVVYQIGVHEKVLCELNNPRFTEWTNAEELITSSTNSLNCYVNGAVPTSLERYGNRWTDTSVASGKVYGLQIAFTAKNMDDISIRYDCDGTSPISVEDSKFLSGKRNASGGYKWWWCANKDQLDGIPQSLRQDLPNWNKFYNAIASGGNKTATLKIDTPTELVWSYDGEENGKKRLAVRVPFLAADNERSLCKDEIYQVKFTATMSAEDTLNAGGGFWANIVSTDPWIEFGTATDGDLWQTYTVDNTDKKKISWKNKITITQDLIGISRDDIYIAISSATFKDNIAESIKFTDVSFEITKK